MVRSRAGFASIVRIAAAVFGLLGLGTHGCRYQANPPAGGLRCASAQPGNNRCPDGYSCHQTPTDGRCVATCWPTSTPPQVVCDSDAAVPSDTADTRNDIVANGGTAGATSVGTGGSTGGTVGGGGTPGTTGVAGTGGSTECRTDQHKCSGMCVDDNSVDHCGTLCDKCQPPPGATATCDATRCDFTCAANMKRCTASANCVPTAGCCVNTDCAPQAGGQTGTCDSGTHMCSYACPANMQSCTGGGTTACIAAGACCTDTDCPGSCQACSAGHICIAAISKDDPTGRCLGTCDTAGSCKSKRGQTCNTTPGGCVAGASCSPDGYCCDQACAASCMACDIPGLQGTCTPVASGVPHGNRTACVGVGTPCGGSCASRTDGACAYPTTANACPVPSNGTATCVNAQCDFECGAGKFKCGNACHSCCKDADCPVGMNEEATCGIDHLCQARCKTDTTRCRGTCRPSRILGACVASLPNPSSSLYWCDTDEDERYSKGNLDSQRAIQGGYNPNDPGVVDQYCLDISDDLTLQYCSSSLYSSARKARMDMVYLYSVSFDSDGRVLQFKPTPSASSRTCTP